MVKLRRFLVEFTIDESGPASVEYAVMLALIVVVCIVAITTLGQAINATFTSIGNALSGS